MELTLRKSFTIPSCDTIFLSQVWLVFFFGGGFVCGFFFERERVSLGYQDMNKITACVSLLMSIFTIY